MIETNLRRVESIYLKARAKFEKWRDAYEGQYYEDIVDSIVGAGKLALKNVPEDIKAASMQRIPEAWKMIEEV